MTERMTSDPQSSRMSPLELRAGLSLASLFALRMLGLFLILPVFAVHAVDLKGGDSQTLIGLALGAYGLTQGLLQIPFGMASDRYGRKLIIVIGLVLFAVGSFIAASATDIWVSILGRAVQGAGAISAAVVALAADLTRDQHRTKVMAMIGASIGGVFALSLMAAPVLYRAVGMDGLFMLIGGLAISAIAVVVWVVPAEPEKKPAGDGGGEARGDMGALRAVLRNRELMRLNLGIFVLHVVQMAMFVVVPVALVQHGGLAVEAHWKVYLPVVLISFALMVPPLLMAENRGRTKLLFMSSVVVMLAVQGGLALWIEHLAAVVVLLTAFFVSFNLLEASLPSLVTRVAPAAARGTAIGVYNTTQALGLFAGGAAGGWLAQHGGNVSVFVFGLVLVALWLLVAAGMQVPGQGGRTLAAGSVQN